MELNELIAKAKNSYISKENLLNILNNLNFEYVEDLQFRAITGFQVKKNKDESEFVQPLGYRIEIT